MRIRVTRNTKTYGRCRLMRYSSLSVVQAAGHSTPRGRRGCNPGLKAYSRDLRGGDHETVWLGRHPGILRGRVAARLPSRRGVISGGKDRFVTSATCVQQETLDNADASNVTTCDTAVA